VWFAAANISESRNPRAKALFKDIVSAVTTDHVVVETWLLLNSRLTRHAADGFWRGIRNGVAEVEKVTLADLEAAWAIGAAFPDQDFSIVDRTSFAVMERLGLTEAASFDHHFSVYRFGPRRDQAFTVLA
jgi:predicted nucleic acid-binding protein